MAWYRPCCLCEKLCSVVIHFQMFIPFGDGRSNSFSLELFHALWFIFFKSCSTDCRKLGPKTTVCFLAIYFLFMRWQLMPCLASCKRENIVLDLSVCPLMGPFVTFFAFCALTDSKAMQPTAIKPIPCETWLSGLWQRGPFFSAPFPTCASFASRL